MDPATLVLSTFALCNPADVDGGVWSAALSRVVVLNDWTNQLETYGENGDGTGEPLPTDVPVSGVTSGVGPGNALLRVSLGGPGCAGLLAQYGDGLAGKDGFVPVLAGAGCPDIGNAFAITLSQVVGGAGGLLFVGFAAAAAPFKGGTFLVGSLALQLPVAVSGPAGMENAGFLSLPAVLADPILIGIDIHLQAGFVDAAAVQGVSLTNGLRVQAG